MDLTKEAIEKILELSDVQEHEIQGRTFTTKALHEVKIANAAKLHVHTLSAVARYCHEMSHEMRADSFVHIIDYENVVVSSSLDVDERSRESYIHATPIMDVFNFGANFNVERFIIALQAQFEQDETTAAILKLVGNITHKAERGTLDDGCSQTITAKTGIVTAENVAVPNPVVLAPFRTFIEIPQPESKFIFRLKSRLDEEPTCSLHEADGGAWKNEAIKRIYDRLKVELPAGMTIIA